MGAREVLTGAIVLGAMVISYAATRSHDPGSATGPATELPSPGGAETSAGAPSSVTAPLESPPFETPTGPVERPNPPRFQHGCPSSRY